MSEDEVERDSQGENDPEQEPSVPILWRIGKPLLILAGIIVAAYYWYNWENPTGV